MLGLMTFDKVERGLSGGLTVVWPKGSNVTTHLVDGFNSNRTSPLDSEAERAKTQPYRHLATMFKCLEMCCFDPTGLNTLILWSC